MLPDAGIEIVNLTDDEWHELAEIAFKVEIPIIEATSGEEILNLIQDSVPWMPK